jgi:hypothetical protein
MEHCWKPGQSGNPGGRPTGYSVRAAIRRRLAKNKDEDGIGELAGELADCLLDFAKGIDLGDLDKVRVQLDALKWATEQAEGKLESKSTVSTPDLAKTITLHGRKKKPPADA